MFPLALHILNTLLILEDPRKEVIAVSILEGSRFSNLTDQNSSLHASAVLLLPAQSNLEDLDFDEEAKS